MTGRIKSLGDAGTSGFITAENGHSVHFESSAVLAYDVTCLAVGQTVSFELESGSHPKAFNVCVQRPHSAPRAPVKHPESFHLRYTGFEQTGNIRVYRFERLSTGEETQAFLVTTDLALFMKHHVGIQEGPTLCLHVLTADLTGTDPTRQAPLRRALTDLDMLAHVASRPAPGSKGRHKTAPRPFTVSHAV
jgi:cold shock CspA family protein